MSTDFHPAETASPATVERDNAARSAVLARDLFRLLDRTIKLRRLYAHEHAACRSVTRDLVERFAAVLDEVAELTLTVKVKTLLVGEEVIHEDERGEASIPYRLFRDGVRLLLFVRGLTEEEIENFVMVLESRESDSSHFDENIATMLWRQGFKHIRYSAVDEIGLPGEGSSENWNEVSDELPRGVELVFGSITSLKLPECSEGTAIFSHIAADDHDIFEMNRQARATRPDSDGDDEGGGDVLDVSRAALERLRSESETNRMGNLIRRVINILFDMFREDESTLEPEGVRRLLGEFLRLDLERGDLAGLNDILSRLREECAKGVGSLAEKVVDDILDDLAGEGSMQLLLVAVQHDYHGGPEALAEYLFRLPITALEHAVEHWRVLPGGQDRAVYEDLLRQRACEKTDVLHAFLKDSPSEDVIAFLESQLDARTNLAVAVDALLDHSDPEVRIRAVSAAGNMDGGAPADLMGKVLDDTAPAVRRAAIRAVEESGDRGPMRLLIKRVADEELSERERALILHCIAVLGGTAAVKCLERHVRPIRFAWVPGRNTAWRDGVIKSLYDVDNSAVQTFLINGISSLDHRYAEACEFALDHHRARGS